ncbi:hypothetical protein AMJ57_00330 [Parcubacteria bacterium SG8_24]|nr:MAG: hypothetical protein AMJ57_00330 [Parcubacteria bacterium SG8_24]
MGLARLKTILKEYGLRPLKSRGQHFLFDEGVVAAMADIAGIGPGDRVVEIGPGWGILTAELLERGARVTAVELDRRLHRLLTDRFGGAGLELRRGDIMKTTNRELSESFGPGKDGYKVVANLPYAITSPVIRKFLLEEPRPVSFTLLVQREVADRITARPGRMASLSVFVQSLADATKAFRVPRGSFYPQPKVDSAVLHVVLLNEAAERERLGGVDRDCLLGVVQEAFSGRRKQLHNSLKKRLKGAEIEEVFRRAGIDPRERPENLSVGEWIRLTRALS